MLLSVFSTVYAVEDLEDGWRVDEDGIERYYVDGEYVTGVYTIGSFQYVFSENDGEYLGVWDGHYNVGDNTLANSIEYESGLRALVRNGGSVYAYYTFDDYELYTSAAFSSEIEFGKNYGSESSQGSTSMYSNVTGIFKSTSKSYFQVVHRYATSNIASRQGGGRMVHVRGSETKAEHTYVNVYAGAPAGKELIVEAEFMLGEKFSGKATLIQLIDRGNVDVSGNYMPGLLNVNASGGVYLTADTSSFVCVLSRNELTRISVAIHPSTNTMDVYINGLLVVKDAKFLTDSKYNAANFTLDELRSAQFTGGYGLGSMFVDNVAIYTASEPVCTVTAAPKNGAYAEGGYLRYYQNNRIIYGNMTVTGEFNGIVYDKKNVNFGDSLGHGGAMLGNSATVIVNGAVNSVSEVAGNVFTAPGAVKLDKGGFGGWKIKDGEKEIFVSPGQRYHMEGDIVCEAVTMDYEMLSGASVRTTAGSSGLRFMAKINRENYDTLISSGVTVEPHIIIVPTAYLENTYGYYTLEALKKSGYTEIIDIKSTEWYETGEKYYYYTASVANILPENYMLDYSGIAYLKVTYPNGYVYDVYADYSEEQNSRSVYRVAHAAYNDRTTLEGQAAYGNKVVYNGKDTFSPYSAERLSVIKGFADKVIMLEGSLGNVVTSGAFYDAPYTVSGKLNSSTMKTDITVTPVSGWDVKNACGVVINGKAIPKGDYVIGSTCTLSIDASGEDISELPILPETVNSWLMFDAGKNYSKFNGGKNTNSAYCHEGQSASVKYSYGSGSGVSLTPGLLQTIGKYSSTRVDGSWYWDMSDIVAMEFAVYSTMDGQTLQFNIYSENPSTDGIDYYGRKLKLNKGWNYFSLSASDFSSSRTPIGWNRVTSVQFTHTGWSQTNSTSAVIYISDITAFDSKQAVNPFGISQLEDAVAFAVGGHYLSVDGLQCRSALDTTAAAFLKNGVYYAPMAPIAAAKGASGKYYPGEETLAFTLNGVSYTFNAGEKSYTANGAKKTLKTAPVAENNALFFDCEDLRSFFGYSHSYIDRMGLVVLSRTQNVFDPTLDYNTIYGIIEAMVYIRPTGDKLVSDLNEYSGGAHPYLMVDREGFERLRYYAEMDATMQKYIASLEKTHGVDSSKYKAAPNTYRLTDGKRLLSISRDVMNKTISWALLAKLYEVKDPALSARYAERCWDELEAACNFSDGKYLSWHPAHFLDTAELAYPVAICYDWLYDYWGKTASDLDTSKYSYTSGTTRLSLLEDSMYWLALAASSTLPSDTTGKYIPYSYNLASPTNNWNGVCNGGLMAAALAIANVDRYAENVKYFIGENITSIERGMWVYAPDGGYEEGPGYWSYGTTYTHIFISSLNSACGTNYGLYNAPGFAHSVYFTTYLGNKNTTWGFHDGGSGSADTGIAPWFALESKDPNVNAIRRQAIDNGWKGVSVYDVMYFDPHIMTSTITLDLDAYYSLDTIMTFRSSWDPAYNIFAGLHGGDNGASHGDLDIGNFVINVNGTYVICDLGSDNYNVFGYFGNYRWSYYRKRAEGQNTIVMIPSSQNVNNDGWDGKTGIPALKPGQEASNTDDNTNLPTPDQIKSAVSKMKRFESGKDSALGVVDMSVAFQQMTSGIRGLYLTDNRSTVIVQDEAVMSENMDIWWFAHTQGEITLLDGGKAAIVERGGIYLYAEIVTDMNASASFSVMDAESLDNDYVGCTVGTDYYTSDTESDRSSFSKLCVRVDDTKELRLAVVFKVIDSPESLPEYGTLYQWTDISSWKAE